MKDGLTQVKELKDKIHEQYIEIQELNKRAEDLKTINEEHQILNGMLRKENDRLNNIINEFDKLIENEINESKLEDDYERVDALEYCLATLKELKGENNE